MSDSDSELPECSFPCKTVAVERKKKIVLDPDAILAERQRNAEIEVKINELINKKLCETPDSDELLELLKQPENPVQKIQYIHPGRSTFSPDKFCSLFSEETLSKTEFVPFQDEIFHKAFKSGVLQFCQLIHMKKEYRNRETLHKLCTFLFYLTSVHSDKKFVGYCADIISSIKENWFPSIDCIFQVFINWGIRSEILILNWIEGDEYVSTNNTEYFLGSHKLDFNIQKVLEIIYSTAREIAKVTNDDKLDKLIQVLALSALEPEASLTPYSRCICVLLSQIPEERWNPTRVQKIAELLFCQGTEDCHNLLVVCNTLLVLNSRAQEVGKFLAYMTLSKLLSDEKKEPMDSVSCQNFFKFLPDVHNLREMSFYSLYIVVRLLNFCFYSDYNVNKLAQDEVCGMIEWLNSLNFYIKTAYDSIDCINLKELIDRTLSDWRLIMQQLKESENTSLDNFLSEHSDKED